LRRFALLSPLCYNRSRVDHPARFPSVYGGVIGQRRCDRVRTRDRIPSPSDRCACAAFAISVFRAQRSGDAIAVSFTHGQSHSNRRALTEPEPRGLRDSLSA
jgi:hypothetical protein